MYRVLFTATVALAVTGCSLGTKSLSLNLNNQPSTKIDPNFVSGDRLGDHADNAATPNRSAIASDREQVTLRSPAPSVNDTATAEPTTPATSPDRKALLNVAQARAMINAYRRQNGLRPLTIDPQLTQAAKAHSLDLAKWDRISHYGSDGSNPWDRVRRSGYSAQLAAENVGTGQTTLKEVFAGWKKSEGHNKNLLLKDAKHMGIALVYDAKTEFKTFWTLVLGTKS